ncbi:MAG: choline dehydrogenase [Mycobacterium sp.]|jgi:choline dehydrogenase|nr:choline dehydrogenase [Mycobacterium sp.]
MKNNPTPRRRHQLGAEVMPQYDFIVCGSGSSGCVVARRLSEDADVSVLLLEAGGPDDMPAVMEADQWLLNLGSERDWNFSSQPSPHVNGRSIPMSMGKVLGGGSSINGMMWSRGHQNDWDYIASEAGDKAWSYESVLNIYRSIEDWHGSPGPDYRGTGGPVYIEPAPNPNPIAPAAIQGARSVGIPTFENSNGQMMEGERCASIVDLRARNGSRQSVFRSYISPTLHRPNLTVLTGALVTRVTFERSRATGVEFSHNGTVHRIGAGSEVVLSLGAIHTPKVLMQSGIGDEAQLQQFGISVVQHLPGGRPEPAGPSPLRLCLGVPPAAAAAQHHDRGDLLLEERPWPRQPGLQTCLGEHPMSSPENAARFGLPEFGWTLAGGVVRPKSRGQIRLTGPDPTDPVRIEANTLSDPADMKAAIASVELCREIGNSAPLSPFAKREVMPGNLTGAELERFVRDAASPYWHQTCTAKMGHDAMSVVDGNLKINGIERLRIADGSILPRVTTGNTMAPCVIIGERAAQILRAQHNHTM